MSYSQNTNDFLKRAVAVKKLFALDVDTYEACFSEAYNLIKGYVLANELGNCDEYIVAHETALAALEETAKESQNTNLSL